MNWLKYSAPQTFYPLAGKMVPWFAWPALILTVIGLYIGFFVAPATKLPTPHFFAEESRQVDGLVAETV